LFAAPDKQLKIAVGGERREPGKKDSKNETDFAWQ
jgi:hypothetical protein